jgi:ABC-type lipoprotein export system ATPase subunit
MIKLTMACFLFSFSSLAQSGALMPGMTVKERLRLSLWYQGIESQRQPQVLVNKQHPEEIERALRKL